MIHISCAFCALICAFCVPLPFRIGGSVVAAYAHHSIAGVYDSGRKVTVEGVVAQFQFINPHPFIIMDVKKGAADTEQWRLEMDNRSELVEIGMTSQTLRPGDHVKVTGSPGRTEPRQLYIAKLDRASDGFQYEQVGTTPRIRMPSR